MRATLQHDDRVNKLEIQFLSFKGCPLAASAKRNLETALAACSISHYKEIDILSSKVTEDMRGWGSPTILINGHDISGAPKGNSVSCRIYPNSEGVPDVESIVAYLRENLTPDITSRD